MPEALQPYLEFVTETAYLAGKLTQRYYQAEFNVTYKADNSPVTIADREAERLIRARIEKQYPQQTILGEEEGLAENADASHRWIIDPIDGTKAFMRGAPFYAILIALEIEGVVEVGVAYFPALNEMVAAATGAGCWWTTGNGAHRRAHVSDVKQLKDGILLHTDPGNFGPYGRQAAWERLMANSYHRPGYGDAYGYLLVATGRAEVMVDPIMNAWDCGPFPPILQEAGGYFGAWDGTATIYAEEGLGTTQTLLPEVLAIIEGNDD
ncbi:MAG: histidinol phosphate phosphatase [Anaerolineales bacterium]|nr:histidinol phosphate phosphatase [Anaerolineales bacterium]